MLVLADTSPETYAVHDFAHYAVLETCQARRSPSPHYECSRTRQLAGKSHEEWVQEMVGMRAMLAKWANVSGISGMRAPGLKPGGNRHFDVSQHCLNAAIV